MPDRRAENLVEIRLPSSCRRPSSVALLSATKPARLCLLIASFCNGTLALPCGTAGSSFPILFTVGVLNCNQQIDRLSGLRRKTCKEIFRR